MKIKRWELERALSFILCVYLMTLSVIPNTLRPLLAGLVNSYLGRIKKKRLYHNLRFCIFIFALCITLRYKQINSKTLFNTVGIIDKFSNRLCVKAACCGC